MLWEDGEVLTVVNFDVRFQVVITWCDKFTLCLAHPHVTTVKMTKPQQIDYTKLQIL